jgi:hypothetical protein
VKDNLTHAYTSTATRDGYYWLVECDQHPGVCSYVTTLRQAVRHQRRGLATVLDIPEDQIVVEVRPVLPPAAHQHLARARELREQSASANHQGTRRAVRGVIQRNQGSRVHRPARPCSRQSPGRPHQFARSTSFLTE